MMKFLNDDEEDWDDDDNIYTLRESYDYDEVAQSEFGMDYDQLGSGEKEWVRDEIDNMSMNEDKIDRNKIEGILWNLQNSNKLSNPSDPKKKEALIKKLE